MPNEVTARTGFRRFDFKRYAAIVVCFCKKLNSIPQTKLNKLLFYADFLACKVSSTSLTGAAYRRLQYGPVPADYDHLLDCLEREEFISIEEKEYSNEITGLVIFAGPKADQADFLFTETEQNVLNRVARKFHDTTAAAISRQSHEESAWRNTEDKQLISYSLAANLSLSLEE